MNLAHCEATNVDRKRRKHNEKTTVSERKKKEKITDNILEFTKKY